MILFFPLGAVQARSNTVNMVEYGCASDDRKLGHMNRRAEL